MSGRMICGLVPAKTGSVFRKLALRNRGQIGIAVPGLMRDFDGGVPEHLTRRQKSGGVFWGDDCWSFHTTDWWRHLWERTGLVDVETTDILTDGWRMWLQFEKACARAGVSHFPSDEEVLKADTGDYLGFIRMVARRKEQTK